MIKDPYQNQYDYNRKLSKRYYRIHDSTTFRLQDNFWNLFKESNQIDEIRELIQPDRTLKDAKEQLDEHREAMRFSDD